MTDNTPSAPARICEQVSKTPLNMLMVGCGNMGGALLERWATIESMRFTVVAPSEPACPEGVHVVPTQSALNGAQFDGIVIAIKPQLIAEVMPAYRENIEPSHDAAIISIAAGTPSSILQALFPQRTIARLMPNMPASIGLGVTGITAPPDIPILWRQVITDLAKTVGEVLWVESDEALNRLTAIFGSGPAYALQFIESFERAARTSMGFSAEQASLPVQQTVLGAVRLATASERDSAALKQTVMSRGGTTAAGIEALNSGDRLTDALSEAVEAAFQRAQALEQFAETEFNGASTADISATASDRKNAERPSITANTVLDIPMLS